jgi:hypothetical protein
MLTPFLHGGGRLGPQQLLVEFADLIERRLQCVIVLQALLHMGGLLLAQTDLMHTAAGITNGENGDRMPTTAIAALATLAVTDGAVEQGAAQDIAGCGKPRQEPVALANDLLLIH